MTGPERVEAPPFPSVVSCVFPGVIGAVAGLGAVTFVDKSIDGPLSQQVEAQQLDHSAQEFEEVIDALAGARMRLVAYHIPVDEEAYAAKINTMETGAAIIRARKPGVNQFAVNAELVGGTVTGLLLGVGFVFARRRKSSRQRVSSNAPVSASASQNT